jgi:hypothetical protein
MICRAVAGAGLDVVAIMRSLCAVPASESRCGRADARRRQGGLKRTNG